MKKKLLPVLLILATLFALFGCSGRASREDMPPDFWIPLFAGELPEVKRSKLSKVELTLEGDVCIHGQERYVMMKKDFDYSWQLDLSSLAPLGRVTGRQTAYVQRDEKGDILSFVLAQKDGTRKWYFKENSPILDPTAYTLEDFTVTCAYKGVARNDPKCSPEYIWNLHTDPIHPSQPLNILDGNWDRYGLELQNKEHPEMTYILEYSYLLGFGGALYVPHQPSGDYVIIRQ